MRVFGPLAALGFALLLMHILMGVGTLPPPAMLILAACLVTLTAIIWWLPRRSRWWPLPALGLVAMATVRRLQLIPPADMRYWFAGAIGPAVAGLSFKYRPWSGIGTCSARSPAWSWWTARGRPGHDGGRPVARVHRPAGRGGRSLGAATRPRRVLTANPSRQPIAERGTDRAARREIRLTEITRRERSLRAAVIPALQLVAPDGEIDEILALGAE